MPNPVMIENIEAMRRREGIDDIDLRRAVRALEIGDFVRLTLLTDERESAGETVMVRVTGIRGTSYQGTLADRPTVRGLSNLPIGLPLVFAMAHIHSIPKARAAHGP